MILLSVLRKMEKIFQPIRQKNNSKQYNNKPVYVKRIQFFFSNNSQKIHKKFRAQNKYFCQRMFWYHIWWCHIVFLLWVTGIYLDVHGTFSERSLKWSFFVRSGHSSARDKLFTKYFKPFVYLLTFVTLR